MTSCRPASLLFPSRSSHPRGGVILPFRQDLLLLGAVPLALAVVVAAARPATAAMARFEVTGRTSSPDAVTLEVVVFLKNAGDAAALPLDVEGELLEERRRMRLDRGIGPGESDHVVLQFPLAGARPGLHALILLIEWPVGPPDGNASTPSMASQRAYLLLTLGQAAEAAVRLSVPELVLETRGTVQAVLESTDGSAHQVEVRVHPPRGLNVFGPPAIVSVPATGRVTASLDLLRAGAPRLSRQGILVEALTLDGLFERAAVATSVVAIAPDPALLPKLRPVLWGVCALLLGSSVYVALRKRRA